MKYIFTISIVLVLGLFFMRTSEKIQGTTLLKLSMEHGGYERSYYLHLPAADKMKSPIPVLFHLHGGGGTAKATPKLTLNRFNELAEEEGFIMVYPDAIEKSWNDGRNLEATKAWREKVDDVGFIVKIIETLQAKYNIDRKRIFTTGMSNGGFMSSRLLCERPDLFRGGAVLTATISEDFYAKCEPSQPTALLLMNGTADPLIPYNGGMIKVFGKDRGRILSTDDYLAFWQDKNACKTIKGKVEIADKDGDGTWVSYKKYEDCTKGGALQLYTIHGGGHTWPGGKQYLGEKLIGKTCREIVACDVIWNFFKELEDL